MGKHIRRFFPTKGEAMAARTAAGYQGQSWGIYDLHKGPMKRKKDSPRRFFVGSHLEWLNL